MDTATTASGREYEHVYLTSDDLEEVEIRQVDAVLHQDTGKNGTRLTLFNGTYLRVQCTGPGANTADFWLNLAFLDAKPIRRLDAGWSSAGAALAVFTLLAAVAVQTPWAGSLRVYLIPGLALGVASTLTCLFVALSRYLGRLVFVTLHGRAPVVWLSTNGPDRKQAGAFIDRLQAAARDARSRRSGNRPHYLRDEMMEHRRLQEQGVLRHEQFQAARGLILRAHG